MWMHLGMKKCRAPSLDPSDIYLDLCISSIFFEVGTPNLVCKCTLGWQSVTYHIRVTVTLTSELVLRDIELWSTYLIFFEVGIPNFFV